MVCRRLGELSWGGQGFELRGSIFSMQVFLTFSKKKKP